MWCPLPLALYGIFSAGAPLKLYITYVHTRQHPAGMQVSCFGDHPRNSTGCVRAYERGFVVVSVATYQQLQRSVGFACGRVGSHCHILPYHVMWYTQISIFKRIFTQLSRVVHLPWSSSCWVWWWGGCTHAYQGLEWCVWCVNPGLKPHCMPYLVQYATQAQKGL